MIYRRRRDEHRAYEDCQPLTQQPECVSHDKPSDEDSCRPLDHGCEGAVECGGAVNCLASGSYTSSRARVRVLNAQQRVQWNS